MADDQISHGFRLYLSCWVRSLLPGRHPGAPLTLGRLIFLLGIFPSFLLIQLLNLLGHALDELLFPGYREVKIREPLFIAGIPRSGTTFWQRTLSLNESSFTTMRSWEAVLAPSVCARKFLRCLARFDRVLGSPVKELTDRAISWMAGDFQNVHEVGYRLPEEDYLTLLPDGGCFLMALAFPFEEAYWKLAAFDELSPKEQDKWMQRYERNLKKHIYADGGSRRLLSKNAAFTSWLHRFPEKFPDACYLLCLREPWSALSSQLGSLKSARHLFAVDPNGEIIAGRFLEIFRKNYQRLLESPDAMAPGQVVIADMEDLKKSNPEAVRRVIKRLNLPLDPPLEAELLRMEIREESPASQHRHLEESWGFDKSEIDALMGEAYREIVSDPASLRNEN